MSKKEKQTSSYSSTNALVATFFIILILFSFYIGMCFGARWAFKGFLPTPSYCYENFGELENDIKRVEVITDSGKTYYFYTDDESSNIGGNL